MSYLTYAIEPADTPGQRQAKLYLAVISLGEWLYQQGAAVAEMNKEYLRVEKELDKMRQELRNIRGCDG